MSKYGQYCPLALAGEILCERWNVLIIHKIIEGCHRFNDIHKGVPKITPTLLSSRLRDLEYTEVITREKLKKGRGYSYHLTEAGEALAPVIQSMAIWGQEWGRDMVVEDLDPRFLLWQMSGSLDKEFLPKGQTVIAFEFTGTDKGSQRCWLVNKDGEGVDICIKNPGYDIDLTVMSDIRLFIEAWRGFRNLKNEISAGNIRLDGSSYMEKHLTDILIIHPVNDITRSREGAEKQLFIKTRS